MTTNNDKAQQKKLGVETTKFYKKKLTRDRNEQKLSK